MAAFSIISETHATLSPLKVLFNFLSDFKNFESILPEDRVTDFTYTENQCSFTIKGITALTIRMDKKEPYQYILFSSEGLAKFNFFLKAEFIGNPDETGQCRVDLSGDMNPFILSMAQKPLTALVNTMSEKLSQLKIK